ncbi:hypothetical protein AB44_5360 [Escherichia coli 3-073-06_S1_C2]|nr:hypothetical protein AB44_5360 [Escherichia coli 3-073-06_S1_C2]
MALTATYPQFRGHGWCVMKLRRQMTMKASGCSSAHTDRQEMT